MTEIRTLLYRCSGFTHGNRRTHSAAVWTARGVCVVTGAATGRSGEVYIKAKIEYPYE